MLKSKKGFTLLELIIVLAVIAVISAIVVPNFLTVTEKSKLSADVQSVKVIQNAIDLYISENGKAPTPSGGETVVDFLAQENYLKGDVTEPQSEGAQWACNTTNRTVKLKLTASTPQSVKDLADKMDDYDDYIEK